MKRIRIKTVKTKHEINDFVNLTDRIYADCPQYVPDLKSDIKDIFNPNNVILEHSEIKAFVAYDEEGKATGRILGIINHNANKKWNTRNVRFGYIEFLDDIEISKALLEAVEKWGREKRMEYIQGPMGFFDFDKEGMLIEDFDQTGSMVTIYNPPYYPKHMETLGYKKEVDWVQVCLEVPKEIPAKYSRVAKLSQEMFGLHVKKLNNTDIYKRGYGRKIFNLINTAYSPLFGYTELSEKQIDLYIDKYLPLIDKKMVPVIENEDGELIGVTITMGSLSHAMQKAKGSLFPFGWYHILRSLKWKREEKAELLLIAIRPDYQGLGVNALFFNDLIPIYNKYKFKYAETGPQLEDNIKELSQWKALNPTYTKRRRCYKKKI
ncbi:N-acetyltransferase [uncultured Bacteroides sp.]|uniref:N-acetyltransferase n=1 Tax=uncultured Bacteroides sp. TaxID=162156 RepID=UPI002594FD2E|nr:N-acetyltransferase [uncultured Bacteroides sp.]